VSAPWPTGAPLAFPSRHVYLHGHVKCLLLEVRIYQSFTKRSQMTTLSARTPRLAYAPEVAAYDSRNETAGPASTCPQLGHWGDWPGTFSQ
jgi:hypothetical protein